MPWERPSAIRPIDALASSRPQMLVPRLPISPTAVACRDQAGTSLPQEDRGTHVGGHQRDSIRGGPPGVAARTSACTSGGGVARFEQRDAAIPGSCYDASARSGAGPWKSARGRKDRKAGARSKGSTSRGPSSQRPGGDGVAKMRVVGDHYVLPASGLPVCLLGHLDDQAPLAPGF